MIIFVERCVQISSVDSMCDTHTLRGTVSSNESNNGSETTTAAPSCTIGRRMHRDACAEPKIFKMSIWHFSRRHHYIATADPRVFSIQRGALHPPMRRARVSASAISCRVLIKSIASRPPAAPPPPPCRGCITRSVSLLPSPRHGAARQSIARRSRGPCEKYSHSMPSFSKTRGY